MYRVDLRTQDVQRGDGQDEQTILEIATVLNVTNRPGESLHVEIL
jgi:hypothetical protein